MPLPPPPLAHYSPPIPPCETIQSRVLHRRDLSTTAQLLASARAEFRAAGDASGASEADEALIKIKADIVMQAVEAARKVRGGRGARAGRGGDRTKLL